MINKKISIRKLEEADYLECISLFQEMGERYNINKDCKKMKSIFIRYTKYKSKIGFIAFENNSKKIVGCLLVEIATQFCKTGKQGRGEGMVVKAKYRGQGIGRMLLNSAAELMRGRKIEDFVVRTPYNWQSINFYRSLREFEERGAYFYYKF